MKNDADTKLGLAAWFAIPPFLISFAFWLSPYAGWPALLVFGLPWWGNLKQIFEYSKKKEASNAQPPQS